MVAVRERAAQRDLARCGLPVRRVIGEARGSDPVYRDAVLVTLLHPDRPVVPDDADFAHALWWLRKDGLVDFGRVAPTRELTPAGRALAERLAACR